ncbi:MAG: CBS domain-containing protein [Elusimicrobia bacterium]|nr:CBS domain-containing protein [Candidatus Liberimonas magnetica]
MLAKEIMTKDVITVKPDMDVHKLAEMFIDRNISGAPVVDDNGGFLGLVLEDGIIFKDTKVHLPTFVYFLSGFFTLGEKKFEDELKKISATTVSGIMDEKPITITPEATMEDIATLMIDKAVHYFPVLENGRLRGVVTKKDIVKAIAKSQI